MLQYKSLTINVYALDLVCQLVEPRLIVYFYGTAQKLKHVSEK